MRRATWAGVAFLLGLGDFLLLKLFGVTMFVGDWDVTFEVVVLFAGNFAGLGWVIGALMEQRSELEEQADVIRDQYDELRATQKRAVEHEKLAAVGRLAAGVAHEVRNPLGVIRTSADMLEEELEDPQSQSAARYICEEVDQLDDFVGRLLDFTRPLEPELEAVDVGNLVDRVAREARDAEAAEGVEVETTVESGLEIDGDPDLLGRLLSGLLHNALEAVGPGGTVVIRASRREGEMTFDVADDGPGVPEEECDAIFEPFHTTKSEGTGLGLAMAKKIAEVHGGDLGYVPGEGAGTGGEGACFRLSLSTETARGGRR